MASAYRLPDEPEPGALAGSVVRPLWPLLATMLAGPWVSWPWFVFNGVAMGSTTRRDELRWAVGGFVGCVAYALLLFLSFGAGLIGEGAVPYFVLLLVVLKLVVSYRLFLLQSRSFALHEHFGMPVSNLGMALLVGATVLEGSVLGMLPAFWRVVLG